MINDEHLTNEYIYISNEKRFRSEESGDWVRQDNEYENLFDNKVKDTRIRLDLHKF